MNLAISTIVVFLFILPGLAFRRFYFTSEFSKEYFKSTAAEVLLLGIIPTLFLHWIGINLVEFCTPLTIDLGLLDFHVPHLSVDIELVGHLITGFNNDIEIHKGLNSIEDNLNYILFYNILLVILGGTLGFLFRVIVRNFKLDRKFKILRFQNEWHYILSSEILDFPKVKSRSPHTKGKRLEAVYIDALIEASEKDGAILYSGILEDYCLSKGGGLELLYLTNTYRRSLKDDTTDTTDTTSNSNSLYELPDHYFIIKYDQVKNLNIFYDFGDDRTEEGLSSSNNEVLSTLIGLVAILAIFAIPIYFLGWFWGMIIGTLATNILSSLSNNKEEDVDEEDDNEQNN